MDNEEKKKAAEMLIKSFRTSNKQLDINTIFEEYELVCQKLDGDNLTINSHDASNELSSKSS
jgi:hypothetical protein